MSATEEKLREATRGTPYEGRLFLVGGVPRDRALGFPTSDDVDIVLEGDALELARFLHRRGLSDHFPVLYSRFGTAMISVGGHQVELVTARAESYAPDSRKPAVSQATLDSDVLRRDFTINTLLENLHTGEVLDLTGRARADLIAGIIRTPLDPRTTFYDDPLRMLRAVRFAVRFGFEVEERTWRAIQEGAHRLNLMGRDPPVVSAERIRDEFAKILMGSPHGPPGIYNAWPPDSQSPTRLEVPGMPPDIGNAWLPDREVLRTGESVPKGLPGFRSQGPRPLAPSLAPSPAPFLPTSPVGAAAGLQLLREANLLAQFMPELLAMVGVTQNDWHLYDVWDHTMLAMAHLSPDAPLELRLALLLHDVGKPATRTEDERGVHFYEHQFVGAEIARRILHRLRFTNDQVRDVCRLVELHMRLGEARPDWSDAAVRRLIRATAGYAGLLYDLARADMAATNPDVPKTDLDAVRDRMEVVDRLSHAAEIVSPLDGVAIMEALGVPPGPIIREAKEFLTNEVIDGRLAPDDKDSARQVLRDWYDRRSG